MPEIYYRPQPLDTAVLVVRVTPARTIVADALLVDRHARPATWLRTAGGC